MQGDESRTGLRRERHVGFFSEKGSGGECFSVFRVRIAGVASHVLLEGELVMKFYAEP